MVKKIGLVTCFINNYGACLQAYALQTILNNYAEKVEIIQYLEPLGYDNNKSFKHRLVFNNFTKSVFAMLSMEYKHSREFRRSCEKFKVKYLCFNNVKYYSYDDFLRKPPNYDVFVCGSDQIWNPTFYGEPNKVYYLDFTGDKKRIAYAPSIGVSDIDSVYQDEFVRLVKKFNYISVREKTGSQLIKKYCDMEAKTVLDPTLLLAKNEWSELANNAEIHIDEKYIFCYLFGNRPFYSEFIRCVSELLNLPIYIVPFTKKQVYAGFHNIYGAGPLEFIKLIKEASFVITDSFHATAFSINMNIPFYSLLRNSKGDPKCMNSRIYDILSLVRLEDRLWDDFRDISQFERIFSWDESNKILSNKRNEDMLFLKNSINE